MKGNSNNMDKIKRWIEIYVPVTTCTLRCSYCYITTHRLFAGPLPKFEFTPDFLRQALSKERLGGTCMLNFCAGGETLLAPKLLDYIRALLEEGHYISIVTNGTLTKRIEEIAEFPQELTAHLFLKFSYHYLQLKERGLLDTFFNNIRMIRDAGCSFTLEQTPSDDAIPYRDEIIERAVKELGAIPHITIARDERIDGQLPILTELSREEYKHTWGDKYRSALFDYKLTIFEQPRKEFCYAGDWGVYLSLATGDMRQCYQSNLSWNIYQDISKPIPFCAIGHNCKEIHCYNGHSWISWGCIPELKAPTYGELRNRVCVDGSEWLQPQMKAFMSSRLYESNEEYGVGKKLWIDIRNRFASFHNYYNKVMRKIKNIIKKQ